MIYKKLFIKKMLRTINGKSLNKIVAGVYGNDSDTFDIVVNGYHKITAKKIDMVDNICIYEQQCNIPLSGSNFSVRYEWFDKSGMNVLFTCYYGRIDDPMKMLCDNKLLLPDSDCYSFSDEKDLVKIIVSCYVV